MINYSMKYGVSETARLFDVDRETIKKWAYIFSDYLSVGANPEKGKPRHFSTNDIRVVAYIFQYWDDDPELEYIKLGLNSNCQFEDDSITDFIISITPLFIATPEDIDDTWRGMIFGGEFELGNIFSTADSFKMSGDKLVEIAHKNRCLIRKSLGHRVDGLLRRPLGHFP